MELTGIVIKVLPLQSGEGRNGIWKKQEYVIETEEQYPKKICFSMWGERIDNANIKEGEQITISFDVESREYEGKWYTQVTAWKAVKMSNQPAAGEPKHYYEPPTKDKTPGNDLPPEAPEDDLPF